MTATESPWNQTVAGQPQPGERAERSRTTTMHDVEMFTEMTGDRNPASGASSLPVATSSTCTRDPSAPARDLPSGENARPA